MKLSDVIPVAQCCQHFLTLKLYEENPDKCNDLMGIDS